MKPPPTLRTLHLSGAVPFNHASTIQNTLASSILAHKALASSATPPTDLPPTPPPTILFFTPPPVYAFGRRDQPPLPSSLYHKLTAPRLPFKTPTKLATRNIPAPPPPALEQSPRSVLLSKINAELGTEDTVKYNPLPPSKPKIVLSKEKLETLLEGDITALATSIPASQFPSNVPKYIHKRLLAGDLTALEYPTITHTPRGGLTTFHGPGQLVIYPILDLRSVSSARFPNGLSARCYVNVLEEATIRTLARCGITGMRTENPGVWVNEQKKIAALGVHLRRYVTMFGVGLNVTTDLGWFDRITACGLEGKEVTSMLAEGGGLVEGKHKGSLAMRDVARIWADEFATSIWGEEGKGMAQRMSQEERGNLLKGLAVETDGQLVWEESEQLLSEQLLRGEIMLERYREEYLQIAVEDAEKAKSNSIKRKHSNNKFHG